MGDTTPVHWLASALLPPLRHFRAPPRILFIAMFSLSVLASAGWRHVVETLRTRPGARSWTASAVAWAAVLVTFADLRLAFAHRSAARPVDARALAAPPHWPGFAQSAQGYRVFRLMPNDGDAYADTRAQGVAERMRRLQPDSNVAAAIATTDGYEEGLLPLARSLDFDMRYHRNLFNPSPDPVLLGLLNARYVMSEAPVASPLLFEEPDLRLAAGIGAYRFFRNGLALPRMARMEPLEKAIDFGRLDGEWTHSRGSSPPTLNLSKAERDYLKPDYRGEVDAGRIIALLGEASSGLSAVAPDCNRIRVKADPLPSDVVKFVLLQTPYPGWQVDDLLSSASGRHEPLTPKCAIASGFEVRGGCAQIVYRPWSFRLGLFISLLAWAALLAILIAASRKNSTNCLASFCSETPP